MFSKVFFSHNKKNLSVENLPDGAVLIFSVHPSSDFAKDQIEGFEDKFESFQKQKVSVFFLTEEDCETTSKIFLTDLNRELYEAVPDIQNKEDMGENLIIFTKKGSDLHFSEIKKMPENDHDWSDSIEAWVENFNNPNPAENGMWKWGQVCPKTADYLCVDCGYVEEILRGRTFPICVVCLSGEIDGPSGPCQEFWEEI